MNGRVGAYIREQKEKLQAMILRGEKIEGSVPKRVIEMAMKDPMIVDSILFDGYMRGIQDRGDYMMENKKPEES